jgi:hypothetical protein
LLPLLALCSIALSSPIGASDPPPTAAQVKEFWSENPVLRLGNTAFLADGSELDLGTVTYRFDDGWFFPIYAGRKRNAAEDGTRIVGLAFAGTGHATLHFQADHEAISFANRLVMRGIRTVEEMAPIASGDQHFVAEIHQGIVLTADPAITAMFEKLDAADGGTLENRSPNANSEVYLVVENRQLRRAKLQSSTAFQTRRALMRRAGMEIEEWIQEDLLRLDLLGEDPSRARWVADFLLEESHGVKLYEPGLADRERSDRWLTVLKDDLGRFDGRHRSAAFALAFSDDAMMGASIDAADANMLDGDDESSVYEGGERSTNYQDDERKGERAPIMLKLSGQPLPPRDPADPTSAPGPVVRVEPVQADVEIRVRPAKRGVVSRVRIFGTLTMKAVGGTVHAFRLDFPRHNALRKSFEITRLDSDHSQWFPTRKDYDGEVIVVLREPLQEGQEITLELDWTDTWSTELARGGKVAGAYLFLPEINGSFAGGAWPFKAKISTPVTLFSSMAPAASGVTVAWDESEDFRVLTVADAGARRPILALGDYDVATIAGPEGMPAVRVALLPKDRVNVDAFPRQMIQTIGFMERMLTAFPLTEIELIQTTEDTNLGGQGVVVVGGENYPEMFPDPDGGSGASVASVTDNYPYFEASIVARGVAQQYFGQMVRPASMYDEWLTRSIPETWAWFYTRAAFGRISLNSRMHYTRRIVEDFDGPEPFYSLTNASGIARYEKSIYYHYGPYVFSWMLRKRIGDNAFFIGMRNLVEQKAWQPVTTEDFQRAWEAASGEDLSPFFDWWVYGGYIPKLRVEYEETQGQWGVGVRGCVRTDIPFGVLEVPVVVRDEWDIPSELWVRVENGIGWFEKEGLGLRAEVEIDPDKLVLAYQRRLKKVDANPCGENPEPVDETDTEETGKNRRRGQ